MAGSATPPPGRLTANLAHACAEGGDPPGDLMAEDHGLAYAHRAEASILIVVEVRAANAAGFDGDFDLARACLAGIALFDAQVAGSVNDDGFHLWIS